MKTWLEVEYSYVRPGSDKIKYKGLRVFKTREEAEKFAAVVYCLAQKNKSEYDQKQIAISKEYLGKGKFTSLKKIYMYSKKEIILKENK